MDAPVALNISNERAYPTPYATSPLLPLLLLSLASQKHSPETKRSFREEYDYVVVGAGGAGAVVASRLSEIPCVSVLLLEAGKPPPRLTEIPGITRSFVNSDIDWKYFTTPQRYTAAGIKNRRIPWPSGKTLGGSTTINAMLYVRGNRRNYDEWAALGAEGWSYEEVLPYFKKLEDNTDPIFLANGFHAVGGPITATRPAYNPVKKLAEVQAVINEGYNFVDPNSLEQIGFYDYQSATRRGQRCSTAKGYLVPAENRTNLDILPNAMVRKVLLENRRAVGVEFDFNGRTRTVRARKEVILSAGTTNTAQLLMLSGIGPMSELKRLGIPLVADLPVGLNFQDHPATFLIYKVNNNLPRFSDELKKDENVIDYINHRIGPLTSSEGFQLMSYLSNLDERATSTSEQLQKSNFNIDGIPDNCVYFLDLPDTFVLQIGLRTEVLTKVILPLANQSLIYCASQLVHPRSIGTVTLRSTNPYDPPVIDPNYFADFRDINDAVQGLKKCQKILGNPALKKIGARPIEQKIPGCEEFAQDNDLYLRCIVGTIVITTNHQVGTAKMGDPRDPSTVVDPQLRVKGIRRLRVVDASVMPTIPWSNTWIPTTMIAEKASDIIKRTIQCGRCCSYGY